MCINIFKERMFNIKTTFQQQQFLNVILRINCSFVKLTNFYNCNRQTCFDTENEQRQICIV